MPIIVIAETSSDLPLTVEKLFPALLHLAPKWQSLGEALSLDEDRLDEIFTNINNEKDEEYLREMLEVYMMRSDPKHNWKEIKEAVQKVEGNSDKRDESTPPALLSPLSGI